MYRKCKRSVDLAAASILLVAGLPLLVLVAVLIKLDSRGPVFYRQQRLGRHRREFFLLKFRTMHVDDARDAAQTFPEDHGITRVGRALRRIKIDELPQLLNVFRGEMSLVGPRPCLPALVEQMDDASLARFDVRPGLTGLAQVNGNIYIDWPERWAYDVRYARELSLSLDLRILLKTVLVVVFGEKRFAKPV